jgi:hypothetical protein
MNPTQIMYNYGFKSLEALKELACDCEDAFELARAYYSDTDVLMSDEHAQVLFELAHK